MAKKGGTKGAGRKPSLSDVDSLYARILEELRANPSHPQWPLLMRGVSSLREMNEVLCRLADSGGDSDFGNPGLFSR